jgi:hypothetical protein
MRKGSAPKTVPGSVRWMPSMRMSLMTKGSTAWAAGANSKAASITQANTRRNTLVATRDRDTRGMGEELNADPVGGPRR